jgi:hypothetical protein
MKIQLLASDKIKDLKLFSQLLNMQLILLEKSGKTGLVVKLLSQAIDKINANDLNPQWRLMTSSNKDEFEFTVVFFAINTDGNLHEYPLYRCSGSLEIVRLGMYGAGVVESKGDYSMIDYILDITK